MKLTPSKRHYLLSAATLSLGLMLSASANAEIWKDVSSGELSFQLENQNLNSTSLENHKARRLDLNLEALKFTLNQAPSEHFGTSNTQIELPLPNGQFRTYTLFHSPIMASALSDRYPEIQTYRIVDINYPENSGRLDLTPEGFHGIVSYNGETVYIDPIGKTGQYKSYFKSDYVAERAGQNHSPLVCTAKDKKPSGTLNQTPISDRKNSFSFGTNLRTYRLAMAATGEFTQFHGGTKESALAAIVTGINRVNQVYERDAAIKLELVANTSDLIFTNAATDPFTDNDADELIFEVGPAIDSRIGASSYDIGHVFSTGGGGLAGFGVVCGEDKSEGVTGSDMPINDPFFIDFVAHEIGHQFSANHTFNASAGSCEDNGERSAAYEPGSGSTIMGYASLCEDEDIQTQSDDYFHTHSLTQISEFIGNASTGGSCGVSTSLNNAAPVSIPGPDGHIPKSTPFILTGSATDANAADTLSYTWEQYDLGTITSSPAELVDDGSRPLFRSFPPKPTASRTFPQISDILSGTTTFGEVLPTTNRDMNFRLTVRDGKGGVATEVRKITVNSAAGPFVVTAPAAVSWTGNNTETISWDVANTTAAPLSCANVDIALSQDGGQSFTTTILAGTPNDGSESITVPNVNTTMGRIRVKCATQPFFAVNSGTVTVTGTANTSPVANADAFTVSQDSAATTLDVLANDTDADGNTLSISSINNISNGATITVSGTGISYQPASGFSGTETFTYTINDNAGGIASAQVSITVTPVTTPPGTGISGDEGSNTLTGTDAAEVMNGFAGNDTLNGGAGNDTIIGGLGNDILTGGAGADRFVFGTGFGYGFDHITDFTTGSDVIEIASGFNTLAQIKAAMTDFDGYVLLLLGNSNSVRIDNMQTANAVFGDFRVTDSPIDGGLLIKYDTTTLTPKGSSGNSAKAVLDPPKSKFLSKDKWRQ